MGFDVGACIRPAALDIAKEELLDCFRMCYWDPQQSLEVVVPVALKLRGVSLFDMIYIFGWHARPASFDAEELFEEFPPDWELPAVESSIKFEPASTQHQQMITRRVARREIDLGA